VSGNADLIPHILTTLQGKNMESKLQAEIIKWLEAKKKREEEKPLSQLEAEAKLFCNGKDKK